MTIETQPAAAAGWYDDPGKSGGFRWWDGAQWTSQLRFPQPPAVAQQPASPPPPPGATANPYGLPPIQVPQFAAITNSYVPQNSQRGAISNRAAWTSLIFGALSMLLALQRFTPGSGAVFLSTTGVAAIVWGVRALVRRRHGHATILWAPIAGIALGTVGSILMISGGITLFSQEMNPSGAYSVSQSAQQPSATTPPTTQGDLTSTPPSFPSSPVLTADEVEVSTLARAIESIYASGNPNLSAGQSWPASIAVTSNSAITAADGKQIATLPPGMQLLYQRSNDSTSFELLVGTATSTGHEIAFYVSAQNAFTWDCLQTDTRCVPAS